MVTFMLLLTLPFETVTPTVQSSITNNSSIRNYLMDISNCSKLKIDANERLHFDGEVIAILKNPIEQLQLQFDLIRMYESIRPICLKMILEYASTPAFNTLVVTAICRPSTVQMFGIENFGDGCGSLIVNGISSRENCLPVGGRVQIECDWANYMVVKTTFGDVLAVSRGATPASMGLDNVARIEKWFGVNMWQAQRGSKSTKCNCDTFFIFSQWALACAGRNEKPKLNATGVTQRSRNSNVLATVMMVMGLLAVLTTAVYHAVRDLWLLK